MIYSLEELLEEAQSHDVWGVKAAENYYKAKALLKEGKFEEARAVPLMPTDRALIEMKILEAQKNAA